MDQAPPAEVLPGLYRAVLDAVADLEARGYRVEAADLRAEATRVYSRAWTPAAARELRILRARGIRVVERRGRPARARRWVSFLRRLDRRATA